MAEKEKYVNYRVWKINEQDRAKKAKLFYVYGEVQLENGKRVPVMAVVFADDRNDASAIIGEYKKTAPLTCDSRRVNDAYEWYKDLFKSEGVEPAPPMSDEFINFFYENDYQADDAALKAAIAAAKAKASAGGE